MTEQLEQAVPEPYTPPMLAEVGEFNQDTLGSFGGYVDWFIFLPG